MQHWRRVPALNMDARFVEDMADMALEALAAPALSVSEAAARHSDVIDSYGSAGANSREAGFLSFGERQEQSGPRLSPAAEMLNGRGAMLAIVATTLLELASGKPIVQMLSH